MLNEENKKLCWEVLSKFGIANQMDMVIEECAELQKAVCKLFRAETKERFENFIEEIVDVIVVCQQMLLNMGVSMDEVNRRAKDKLERALEYGEES